MKYIDYTQGLQMSVQRPIFTTASFYPVRVVSVREVREGLDASKTMSRPQRCDYLGSLGIDLVKVEQYLETVEQLERLTAPPTATRTYFSIAYLVHLAFMTAYRAYMA